MGLTIHYQLRTRLTEPREVRNLVESLRQFARDLPFKEVGELLEFTDKDADYAHSCREDEHRWFKIQAGQYVEAGNDHCHVTPLHIIGFSTWPGEGCEPANFGFCRYPASIEVPVAEGRKRRLITGLDGWRWGSFCKTQYASDPKAGGIPNFLRCHLSVVKLLDFIRRTELVEVEVNDEGEYWQHRDIARLAREVGEWNEQIAAFVGQLNDAVRKDGVTTEAAITGFANFEQLEARGLERLRQRMRQGD